MRLDHKGKFFKSRGPSRGAAFSTGVHPVVDPGGALVARGKSLSRACLVAIVYFCRPGGQLLIIAEERPYAIGEFSM